MKYVKLFETAAAYNAATLDLPNVSLIEENMSVSYNPWVETRIVAKFNVTNTSSSINIANNTSNLTEIEIDGVVQSNVVSAYTFSTTGEHTVKYTLTDPTNISAGAFNSCSGLTSIDIPDSVTSIGISAFGGCSSLTSVIIGSGVTSIGNGAFYGCSGLTSIDIPSGVTSIGDSTFYNCSSLTSIDIPSGVTSIGQYAFRNCDRLTSIVSNAATAPTIQSSTFQNIKTNGTLTVPSSSTGYDVWMGTGNYYLGKYNWTKVEQ